ncbi:MAG: Gfo/Idh/MocA family protein [Thermoguttaceae bacterium]
MQNLFLTRRRFLGTSAAGLASVTIVPRCAVAVSGRTSPNEKLNIAGIGVGGQGAADMGQFSGENIVALCDVDTKRAEGTLQKFPKAKTFHDFRKMFDAMEKRVDAVLVATPDHTHAVAAMAAIRRGKHVYCEKPLAHSVYEVRQLMKAAAEHKVVTQLGNHHVRFAWGWRGSHHPRGQDAGLQAAAQDHPKGSARLPSPGLAAGHPQGRQVGLRFLLRRAADGNRLAGRHRDQIGRQEARVGRPGHAIHQLP